MREGGKRWSEEREEREGVRKGENRGREGGERGSEGDREEQERGGRGGDEGIYDVVGRDGFKKGVCKQAKVYIMTSEVNR